MINPKQKFSRTRLSSEKVIEIVSRAFAESKGV